MGCAASLCRRKGRAVHKKQKPGNAEHRNILRQEVKKAVMDAEMLNRGVMSTSCTRQDDVTIKATSMEQPPPPSPIGPRTPPIASHVSAQNDPQLSARSHANSSEHMGSKSEHLTTHEKACQSRRCRGPVGLAPFLHQWWMESFPDGRSCVSSSLFLATLTKWLDAHGHASKLQAFHQRILSQLPERFSQELGEASASALPDDPPVISLRLTLLPLMCINPDGMVTHSELYQLQLMVDGLVKQLRWSEPSSWPDLLRSISSGLSPQLLLALVTQAQPDQQLQNLSNQLQVKDAIQSCNRLRNCLLDDYLNGSWQRALERVQTWLQTSMNEPFPCVRDDCSHGHVLLLLAEVGMGKSLLCALLRNMLMLLQNQGISEPANGGAPSPPPKTFVLAHHTFKSGYKQSDGRCMVLCLAQQLAEQLPGLAAPLLQILALHRLETDMSMHESFEMFLLKPLLGYDKKNGQTTRVVLLLDALDEAQSCGLGSDAVVSLIARDFSRLPNWVKVITTGRPGIQRMFQGCALEYISADEQSCANDLFLLTRSLLKHEQYVSEEELDIASRMVAEKSQGRFLYPKLAMDMLCSKTRWTVAQLSLELPMGLDALMGQHLRGLQSSLAKDAPELLTLLNRTLAVLGAAYEPLTLSQLATVAHEPVGNVSRVLRMLASWVSIIADSADMEPRISLSHLVIVEWLQSQLQGGELGHVDVEEGHSQIGRVCTSAIRKGQVLEDGSIVCGGRKGRTDDSLVAYGLRYAFAHLSRVRAVPQMEELVLEFVRFWQQVYAAGHGPEVKRDVLMCELWGSSEVLRDVGRWLWLVDPILKRRPWAALQLAYDAPESSLVARHVRQSGIKPAAMLCQREHFWPACMYVLHRSGTCLALSANARTAVLGTKLGPIRVLELATGLLQTSLLGHAACVTSVAMSPDASLCVSGSRDRTVRLWSLRTGQCTQVLEGHQDMVSSVTLTPDLTTCVSSCVDKTTRVWDLHTGKTKSILRNQTSHVESAACTSDGALCLTGCRDGSVSLWNTCARAVQAKLSGHAYGVTQVAMSSDGRLCASASSDRSVRIWDMEDGGKMRYCLEGHSGQVEALALSNDGRLCVSGSADHTIRLWDLKDGGKLKAVFSGHQHAVHSVALNEDASICVSASLDESLRVWDLDPRCYAPSNLPGHDDDVGGLAVSKSATLCATGSEDKTLRLWDMVTGQQRAVLKGHTDEVSCVALSVFGDMCVTGSADRTVRLWDLRPASHQGKQQREQGASPQQVAGLRGHEGTVTCVALNADCSAAASASVDRTVRIWDLRSKQLVRVLTGHTSGVKMVSISPDGLSCVSHSKDWTVRRWSMECGEELEVLEGPEAEQLVCVARGWGGHFVGTQDQAAGRTSGSPLPAAWIDKAGAMICLEPVKLVTQGEEGELRQLGGGSEDVPGACNRSGSLAAGMQVTAHAHGPVYVVPPYSAASHTIMYCPEKKRLCCFSTHSHRFLCYQLP